MEVMARAPPQSNPRTVTLMSSHADRQRSPNQGDSQPSVQKGCHLVCEQWHGVRQIHAGRLSRVELHLHGLAD